MRAFQDNPACIPEEHLRIQAKSFHPSEFFEEFQKEDSQIKESFGGADKRCNQNKYGNSDNNIAIQS